MTYFLMNHVFFETDLLELFSGVTSSPFLLNGRVTKHSEKFEDSDREFVSKFWNLFLSMILPVANIPNKK